MKRRLSISRLMVTIGLLGASMSLLKSWVGPSNFFGLLGLMLWMAANFWIAAYATTDSAQRFFIGAGFVATCLLVIVFVAPLRIVGSSWDHLIFPLIRWLASNANRIHYQYQWYWVETNLRLNAHFDQGVWGLLQIRTSIGLGSPDIQVLLLIPHGTLSILGGLVTTFVRRPKPRPTESLATRSP